MPSLQHQGNAFPLCSLSYVSDQRDSEEASRGWDGSVALWLRLIGLVRKRPQPVLCAETGLSNTVMVGSPTSSWHIMVGPVSAGVLFKARVIDTPSLAGPLCCSYDPTPRSPPKSRDACGRRNAAPSRRQSTHTRVPWRHHRGRALHGATVTCRYHLSELLFQRRTRGTSLALTWTRQSRTAHRFRQSKSRRPAASPDAGGR
jgi:hypothetical protein